MPPVFAHGRLRLYLLKLLDETPRHGYELIRLLEERFQGLYAPSAGTVYPRLAKLEAEGLIEHATEGGRKVYSITAAGLAELADRQGELADLELEIHESLTALADEIREDVRDSASELRREVFEATRNVAAPADGDSASSGAREDAGARSSWPDQESWQRAKDELLQAKRELQRQARRARDESRRARQQAKAAEEEADRAHHKARQEAHKEAREAAEEEVRRIARTVQDQVQERARTGDWQGAVREGMAELAKEMGTLGRITGQASAWPPFGGGWSSKTYRGRPDGTSPDESAPGEAAADADSSAAPEIPQPEWATEPLREDEEPTRALERLLDRFRDDVRDASRDHGVTREQLHEIRRELSGAAVHIGSVLRPKD
ncbi:helix-turn-helix transcriptional regulator [Streptomyces sp. P38-E01]|uniref:Helix-turn-helix transcriptional regulator n=1 Tax=Streptomyces tardus TaxID=2780544 RepID=A0A949JAH3_9ACTN|nr:PadR family transcriptional regulator [Streptomyces tardus]MBU7596462.1 helix-turn-helix transcriptional regulator [Streptomyces tardus]